MAINIDARAQELIESGVITTMENQKIPPERYRGVIINEDKYRTYQVLLFGPSPYFSNAYKYEILPQTLVYIEMPPGFYHYRIFHDLELTSGSNLFIGDQKHYYDRFGEGMSYDILWENDHISSYRKLGYRRLNSTGHNMLSSKIMERADYPTIRNDSNNEWWVKNKQEDIIDNTRYLLWENFVIEVKWSNSTNGSSTTIK